eukprot:6198323-Pleurochrysis_carterae.AAC.1
MTEWCNAQHNLNAACTAAAPAIPDLSRSGAASPLPPLGVASQLPPRAAALHRDSEHLPAPLSCAQPC